MQVFEPERQAEVPPPAAPVLMQNESRVPPESSLYWVGVTLLGLICRAAPFQPVLLEGEVRLLGTDAWYHARRIHETVLHWPQLLAFDPYLNHPTGALNPYEAGLDLVFATLIRILHFWREPSFSESAALSAVLMPLVGLLVIPLYARMARMLGGAAAGRWTGLILAFLPAVTLPGTLGMVDHHVLEPLLIGAPVLLSMKALGVRAPQRSMLLSGALLGSGLFFWRGMLLPALLLAGFWTVRAALQARSALVDRLTRDQVPFAFLLASVLGLAVVVPVLHEPVLTYFMVSLLQPAVLGLLSLGLYGVGMLATQMATAAALGRSHETGRLTPPDVRTRPRGGPGLFSLVLGLSLIGFLPLGLVCALWPALGDHFLAAFGFLARADRFVQTVGEQRPLLLSDEGALTLSYLVAFYGAFCFLLPGWGWRTLRLELRSWRETGGVSARAGRWQLFLLASCVTAVLALLQRRYAAHWGPFYAVWMGLGVASMLERLRAQSAEAGRELLQRALVWRAMLTSILLLPTLLMTVGLATTPAQDPALMQAMTWMREHTPQTAGASLAEVEAGVHPEYGVLAPWDEGHQLVALAQRPNVANPFGIEWFYPGIVRAAKFWLAPSSQLATAMALSGARYAVLSFRLGLLRDEALFAEEDPDLYAQKTEEGYRPGPQFWSLGAVRAFLEAAPVGAPPEFDPLSPPVPGVRLIWEGGQLEPDSPAQAFLPKGHAAYKIIERVAGATVEVHTQPGAKVEASQQVVTPTGRRFLWTASSLADGRGVASLQAVYSTQGLPSDWARGDGPLQLELPEGHLTLSLSEEDILQGRTRTLPEPALE